MMKKEKTIKISVAHWEKLRNIAHKEYKKINGVLFDILEEHFSGRKKEAK